MKTQRRGDNLIITGFSGTGKSVVARQVARRLGWDFVDTDDEIVKQAGRPIAAIFRDDGEAGFRRLEREAIRGACRCSQRVIAIGGGAIVDPRNYELLARAGLIICLEAKPETIYQRLFREDASSPEAELRPLLDGGRPLERIRQLKESRQPYYAKADWTIHTDDLTAGEVAEEVIRAWTLLGRNHARLNPVPSGERKPGSQPKAIGSATIVIAGPDKIGAKQSQKYPGPRLPRSARNDIRKGVGNEARKSLGRGADKDVACMVRTDTRSYPVFVGYGLLDRLGEKMRQAALSGAAIIISDENVFSLYGNRVEEILKDAGLNVDSLVVPPGEETKSMGYAAGIYDFLVERRVERDDIIVALGGGVVGDLAGFVAATFLRGMPWIQVPTSLVAMVDASIGGKVGVNHPEGKNLIGAFYQPELVLVDVQTLSTLPQRELASGWAEVIKHGLILDEDYFEFVESNVNKLRKLEPGVLIRAIGRSAAIKAQVVSEDEREREGRRTILNYGHTIGHGLEAATEYKRFLHGEAVAIGMMGAAKLSQRLGLLPSEAVERQQAVLQKFALPTSARGKGESQPSGKKRKDLMVSLEGITKAMELDKKVRGKVIRWVLLQDIGQAVIRSDIAQQDVLAVLRELAEP
jgi:3-dehydroquinate synthase